MFSLPTVHDLTFASALAIGGLALVGLIAHELSVERAVESVKGSCGGGTQTGLADESLRHCVLYAA